MVTLTINCSDEKYTRLTQLADYHHIKIPQLLDELTTGALMEFEIYTRFLSRATQGQVEEGLILLDKLETSFEKNRFEL
jgi:hypothetical protein